MATVVDIGQVLDKGGWTPYQRWAVFLAAVAVIFDGLDIQLLGVAIPSIMKEWNVTRSAFAPLVAIGLIGMSTGTVISGMIGDRFGRRIALLSSVVIFGTFTALCSQAESLTTLAFFRFLAGLGLGGGIPNGVALASEFVPLRQRAFAVTLTIVCIPLGGVLAGAIGGEVLPAYGWRTLFVIGGALPILAAILLAIALPESLRFLAQRPDRWPELRRTLSRFNPEAAAATTFTDLSEKTVKAASLAALFTPELRRNTLMLWGAFLSCLLAVYCGFNWLPSMLSGAGLDVSVASRGLAVFNLGGVFGAVIGALFITRLGSKSTMLTLAALAIAGGFILMATPINAATSGALVVVMLAITGGSINAVQSTMFALATHVYPTLVRATGVGAASAVGRTGALLSSFAGAWAIEQGGSHAFFMLMASAMIATFIFLALLTRHIPRPLDP
jgi:AAHS family 4-hydroxybenzoate transporter-like MFS transporter